MYTYEQFRPGDLIRSTWANKLENLGLRVSKFYGVVQNVTGLPDAQNIDDGHWQIVLEDLSLRIVKNKRWNEYVPRLSITLEGDVVGTQTQNGNNIVISTSNKTKITGVQVYGDVVGSGHVLDSILVLNTEIPGKLRQIVLTGAVEGSGTVQSDGTVSITTSVPGAARDSTIVLSNSGVRSIDAGPDSQKPEPGVAGRIYIQRDTRTIYYDTGTEWRTIAFYPQAQVIRETPGLVPPASFGVNYLYTIKNGDVYEVYVANGTSQEASNTVVFVPNVDLEIQSPSESLKIAYGFPYYIEKFGPDEEPVLGFYTAILIPETIPPQTVMTMYVEKVPGFQPDKTAIFADAPLLKFYRDSEASDEPSYYGTTLSPKVGLVPKHVPRFSSYGIHIEPERTNLLDPWYARCEFLPSFTVNNWATPTMQVSPPGFRSNWSAIPKFTVNSHPPMPGYYYYSTQSTGWGTSSGSAYQDLGGYVVSYIARRSDTSWTRWQPSMTTATTYYMLAQSEPPPPTSFVFPGMTRKVEKLFAPDFNVYSATGLAIEFEVTTIHNMSSFTRPLLHIEGGPKVRIEHTSGSTNTLVLAVVLGGTTYKAQVSKASTPSYIRASFYTNNTAKLTVTWSDGTTSSSTVTLPASVLALTGTLYIGCSPVEGEEQVHAIRHVMFSSNPDHDGRQNSWSVTDPQVLLFYPLRFHTLPTKY